MVTDKRKKELDRALSKYSDMVGLCCKCHDWTNVLESCCGASVESGGSTYNYESIFDNVAETDDEYDYLMENY